MSKHKKTRNQKIITGLKRKLNLKNASVSLNNSSIKEEDFKLSNNNNNLKLIVPKQKEINSINVFYSLNDLLKTCILTSIIVFFQLFIFVLLKNQIIKLPMLNF